MLALLLLGAPQKDFTCLAAVWEAGKIIVRALVKSGDLTKAKKDNQRAIILTPLYFSTEYVDVTSLNLT